LLDGGERAVYEVGLSVHETQHHRPARPARGTGPYSTMSLLILHF
jgi:hypothetical protein